MTYPNGSSSVLSRGPWGQLVGVNHCPCADGVSRKVSAVGVPDTMWSAPGTVQVRGKSVRGFVTCDEQGYTFHASRAGKNYNLLAAHVEDTCTEN